MLHVYVLRIIHVTHIMYYIIYIIHVTHVYLTHTYNECTCAYIMHIYMYNG